MTLIQRPVIVIGSGGHARVLIDTLKLLKIDIKGIADLDLKKGSSVCDVEVIGSDDDLVKIFSPQSVLLVNGVGTVRVSNIRKSIFEKYKTLNYQFLTVVHPESIVAEDVVFGEGVQVMAGAVIQTGSKIDANTIINTSASVDHDCEVGAHVHIAPGAVLCGGVHVGDRSHIGTGAVIVQNCRIEPETLVRAGKVFTGTDIPGFPQNQDNL